jgi:alkylation response protein AidB-like acyl-CoA dehydrogenase
MTLRLVPGAAALDPDTERLRGQVREFVAAQLASGEITPRCDVWLSGWDPAFSRRLAECGRLGLTLPTEYGGHGRSTLERYVVTEELLAVGAPVAAHWIADRQIGPAVTQQIALAAGDVAACRAAVDAAVRSAASDGFGAPRTALAVAVAKSRTSAAAGAVAAIAHQVHGAMGFTLEHRLRLVTTRMWSWREEYGNEAYWDGEIGAAALTAGSEGLWGLITAS